MALYSAILKKYRVTDAYFQPGGAGASDTAGGGGGGMNHDEPPTVQTIAGAGRQGEGGDDDEHDEGEPWQVRKRPSFTIFAFGFGSQPCVV
eukprot:COSAG06_NODE_13179_length_1283_cov_0.855818_2_plen_91_part_00